MTTTSNVSTKILFGAPVGFTKTAATLCATLVLAAKLCGAEQPAEAKVPALNFSAAGGVSVSVGETATNAASPVAAIQNDLEKIKQRVVATAALMSNAVSINVAQTVTKISSLADAITDLATTDLGDNGNILKQCDSLAGSIKESLATARKCSTDVNIGPSAREIYARLIPGLEKQVNKLIDARSTVAQIRAELLRQAESMRANSAALAFSDKCQAQVVAAVAFANLLADVNAFAVKISSMITETGKNLGPVS